MTLTSTTRAAGRARFPRRPSLLNTVRVAAALALAAAALLTPGFLSRVSLLSLATATSFVGCVAVGMTFITLGGNIMSFALGITLSATTVVFVRLLPLGLGAAVAGALAFSAALTAAQGWLVGMLRANPIIVSLAALSLITGAATWLTGGMGVYPDGNEAEALRGQIGPLPLPLAAFLLSVAIGQFVVARTRFGRQLVMVGSNAWAAEVAGVRTWWVVTTSYLLAGLFTGVAAVLMAARYSSGDLELGSGYDYSAISAVIVGGTSIAGGEGSPLRTLFGAFAIATVQALLVLWGFSTQVQSLAIGLIVLAVIMLQTLGERS